MPQQQHHQQHQYPFQQVPPPFMQQQYQHQHFQQQAGLFPHPQANAYPYGNQFDHYQPDYHFQQQQHQAPPPWGAPYEGYGGGGNSAPASAPVPLEPDAPPPSAEQPSTELALPQDSPPPSPRGELAAHTGSFSHPHAATAATAAAAAAASLGMVTHAAPAGFTHQAAPSYGPSHGAVLPQSAMPPQSAYAPGPPPVSAMPSAPPAPPPSSYPSTVLAPPSVYPPSSESEGCSDSESEENDRNLAVARYGGPPAPAHNAKEETSSSRFGILRRGSRSKTYPTETRYVPPKPERLNANYYPREDRGQQQQQQQDERPGLSRGNSGLVLKVHVGTKGPGRGTAPPPTSVGPYVGGSASRRDSGSSRGSSERGIGGLIKDMDRMFSDVMRGGMLDAGITVGVAGQGGAGSCLTRSFSAGGSGSSFGSGGGVRSSLMSSHTVIDASSRTLFSRTERTVVGEDGTRDTKVIRVLSPPILDVLC